MSEVVNISLDKRVLDIMFKYSVKLADVFIIMSLYGKKISVFTDYVRDYTSIQKTNTLKPLVEKGLVAFEDKSLDFDLEHYRQTALGYNLYAELVTSMELAQVPELPKKDTTGFDQLVTDYLELFPAGVKNGGGKTIKSNYVDTAAKLKRFIIKYGYDGDTILKATKGYLDKLRGNYNYCPTAAYFIMKSNESALATECDMTEKNGGTTEIINPFERRM